MFLVESMDAETTDMEGWSVSVATAQQTTSAPWATQAPPPLKAHGQDFIRNTEGERETDICGSLC